MSAAVVILIGFSCGELQCWSGPRQGGYQSSGVNGLEQVILCTKLRTEKIYIYRIGQLYKSKKRETFSIVRFSRVFLSSKFLIDHVNTNSIISSNKGTHDQKIHISRRQSFERQKKP